ncbi:MAG: PL29 family lyase N-terminal domain-containing protein [Bacteroidales bacterium]|nr:PL29 family lyase N-terminal domain-containing protein [Bacteroidales bacterium]
MRLNKLIKTIPFFVLGLSIFSGCEERDDISDRNRLYRLENRFTELEELCNIINKNSANIKKLLQEQAKRVNISNVYKMQDGYVISFTDGEFVELHHGNDGKDGKDGILTDSTGTSFVPVIGVKIAEDGLHYWTLNGEWLLDENGKMVLAEGKKGDKGDQGEQGEQGEGGGIVPLMKIENGYWMVSYDQGKTWEIIGQATGKDGKDGKDGICPQLKIENGVWHISYDNGVTWEAIGSAVGQDGKTPSLKIEDGKLMISWDQGVTWEMVEGGDVFGELSKPGTGVAEGHKWINLGLPSGNLWASCNVGANSPSEWGKYYAWGDTITKSEYSSTNCMTFGKTVEQLALQGYTNRGGVLNPTYDVAQHYWGGYWKIPTREDFQELINECSWTWTNVGGVEGYEIKSKQEGNTNSIFLPAAGSKDQYDIRNQGTTGWYWASVAFSSNDYLSWNLTFNKDEGIQTTPLSRRSGFTIRAIYVEP